MSKIKNIKQKVNIPRYHDGFDIAFNVIYLCSQCGWSGKRPQIAGVIYPYANVCPMCGGVVVEK